MGTWVILLETGKVNVGIEHRRDGGELAQLLILLPALKAPLVIGEPVALTLRGGGGGGGGRGAPRACPGAVWLTGFRAKEAPALPGAQGQRVTEGRDAKPHPQTNCLEPPGHCPAPPPRRITKEQREVLLQQHPGVQGPSLGMAPEGGKGQQGLPTKVKHRYQPRIQKRGLAEARVGVHWAAGGEIAQRESTYKRHRIREREQEAHPGASLAKPGHPVFTPLPFASP